MAQLHLDPLWVLAHRLASACSSAHRLASGSALQRGESLEPAPVGINDFIDICHETFCTGAESAWTNRLGRIYFRDEKDFPAFQDSAYETILKETLKENRQAIVDRLNPHDVLDSLRKIFSDDEWEHLRKNGPTKREIVRLMLDYLEKKTGVHYKCFIDVLTKNDYYDLAALLDMTRGEDEDDEDGNPSDRPKHADYFGFSPVSISWTRSMLHKTSPLTVLLLERSAETASTSLAEIMTKITSSVQNGKDVFIYRRKHMVTIFLEGSTVLNCQQQANSIRKCQLATNIVSSVGCT